MPTFRQGGAGEKVAISANDTTVGFVPTIAHMPTQTRQRWFLKEWRKHRGLSQEKLAERLGIYKGDVSNLENGKRRYNQDILEALAEALACEPADLIMRNPTSESIWSIWEQASEGERADIVRVAEALTKGKKAG
jgi:DNA-binding Xre family transcriptional regulator